MTSVLFRTCDAETKHEDDGFDMLNRDELLYCDEIDNVFDDMNIELDHLYWFLTVFFQDDQVDLDALGVSQWHFAISYYGLLNSMLDYIMDKFEIEMFDVVTRNRLIHDEFFQHFIANIFSTSYKEVRVSSTLQIILFLQEND